MISPARSLTIAVAFMFATSGTAMAQTASPHPASKIETRANTFADFVAEASQRFAIPVPWINAVMQVESNGDPNAMSLKGAMGLMQLAPETWTALRGQHHLGADPFDPHDNILAGAAYLRQLYDRFGETGFLAAYNAGPGRYENDLTTGRPLPAETRAYLAKLAHLLGHGQVSGAVLANYNPSAWAQSSLFIRPTTNGSAHGIADNDSATTVQTGRTSASHSVDNAFALAPQSDDLFVYRAAFGELP